MQQMPIVSTEVGQKKTKIEGYNRLSLIVRM